MQFLNKFQYKTLYWAWGILYALTGVLGIAFPQVENGAGLVLMRLLTVAFFLPPWMILLKARFSGEKLHVSLIRNLSIVWLALSMVFFCAAIVSVGSTQAMGDTIHMVMSLLCAPLVCSGYYVLPMFLWATLLVYAVTPEKKA